MLTGAIIRMDAPGGDIGQVRKELLDMNTIITWELYTLCYSIPC